MSPGRQIKWRRIPALPPRSCYGKPPPPCKLQQRGGTLSANSDVFVSFFCFAFLHLYQLLKVKRRDKYKLATAACEHMTGGVREVSRVFFKEAELHQRGEASRQRETSSAAPVMSAGAVVKTRESRPRL